MAVVIQSVMALLCAVYLVLTLPALLRSGKG